MKKLLAIFVIVLSTSAVLNEAVDWNKVKSGEINLKVNKTIQGNKRRIGLQGRIFNASFALKAEHFPYQIGLLCYYKNNATEWCGGSILNEDYILTAAHCLQNFERATVYAGTLNRKTPEENSIVMNVTKENFIIHNGSDSQRIFDSDIGMIHLPVSLKFNDRIKPIKLINSNDADSFDKKVVVISGWGNTTDLGNATDVLKHSKSKILSRANCQEFMDSLELESFGRINTESLICANPGEKTGICGGDSGGAAAIKVNGERYQVGVNSVGLAHGIDKNCESVVLNVFVRVTEYYPWICAHSTYCPE